MGYSFPGTPTTIDFDNEGRLDSRVPPTFDDVFLQLDRDAAYLATPESMANGDAPWSMPQTPYSSTASYQGAIQHTSAGPFVPTNLPHTALSYGDGLGMPSMDFQGPYDFGLGTPFSERARGGLPSLSPSSSPLGYQDREATINHDLPATFQSPQNFMGMQHFRQSGAEQYAEEEQQQQQQREAEQGAEDEDTQELCYARLIHQCLSEAPNKTLPLQKIYSWIEANSCKAKGTSTRALHNSVRHNLSMNKVRDHASIHPALISHISRPYQRHEHSANPTTLQAFERVVADPTNRHQEKHCWRLASKALAPNSLLPTTHYREPPKHAKSSAAKRRSDQQPAIARQISGAKGGKVTRRLRLQQQQQQAARSAVPSVSGEEMGGRQQMPLPEFSPDGRGYRMRTPYWDSVGSQAQPLGMTTPYPTPSMGAQHMEHDAWFSAMPSHMRGVAARAHAATGSLMGFAGEHESAASSEHVDSDTDLFSRLQEFNTDSFN